MLTYFFIGAAIGALTGVPIGPVNVAVIDTAYRHSLARALAVGVGGAIADGLYALLGIVGIGPYLERYPDVTQILFGVTGILLVIYGLLTARSKPVKALPGGNPSASQTMPRQGSRGIFRGFMLGLALILLNPAAGVTWVGIVGKELSGITQMQGYAAALGITVGSGLWFAFVAYLADHGKRLLGDKAVWITRIVGILLVGYGLFLLARASFYINNHML